jgi:hypothetical protein
MEIGPKILEEKSLFSVKTFSAGGGRTAYDLENFLKLPAAPEMLFYLTKDNARLFVTEFKDLFGERSFQMFSREIIGYEKIGRISNAIKKSSMSDRYGWTIHRRHAKLDSIQINPNRTEIVIRLKNTDYGSGQEERVISVDAMPKIAFLQRRFPQNINIEKVVSE